MDNSVVNVKRKSKTHTSKAKVSLKLKKQNKTQKPQTGNYVPEPIIKQETAVKVPKTTSLQDQSKITQDTHEVISGCTNKVSLKENSQDGVDSLCEDFKVLRRSKRQKLQDRHFNTNSVEEEEIQLALAISASITPEFSHNQKKRKRRKKATVSEDPPPLLTTSTPEAKQRMMRKAEAMMITNEECDEIPCTPAIKPSTLAVKCLNSKETKQDMTIGIGCHGDKEMGTDDKRCYDKEESDINQEAPSCNNSSKLIDASKDHHKVQYAQSDKPPILDNGGNNVIDYQTIWQLSAYHENEPIKEFYVPALQDQVSPVKENPINCRLCQTKTDNPSIKSSVENEPSTSNVCSVDNSHSNPVHTLIQDLRSLLQSGLFSDVTILTAEGKKIPAHSSILACRCPAMTKVLTESLVDLSSFTTEAVQAFLEYLYTAKCCVPINEHIKMELSTLAEIWGINAPVLSYDGISSANQHSEEEKQGSSKQNEPSAQYITSETTCKQNYSPEDTAISISHTLPEQSSCVQQHITQLSSTMEACPIVTPSVLTSEKQDNQCDDDSTTSILSSHDSLVSIPGLIPDPILDNSHRSIPSPAPLSHTSSVHSPSLLHHKSLSPKDSNAFTETEDTQCDSYLSRIPYLDWSPLQQDSIQSLPPPLIDALDPNCTIAITDNSPTDVDNYNLSLTTIEAIVNDTDFDVHQSTSMCGSDGKLDSTVTDKHTEFAGNEDLASHVTTPANQKLPSKHKNKTKHDEFESDTNITPMPSYRTMATPSLKEACSLVGVRVLPKKKMVAKLEEIYNYTHPLVDKDNNIVSQPVAGKDKGSKKMTRNSKRNEDDTEMQSLLESVIKGVHCDNELHQDILLYQPFELTFIQSRLKAKDVSISRDKLMDILDKLCITYTIPRLAHRKN